MGDRYTLDLRCDWCGELNEGVYYAESSGVTDFTCQVCDEKNDIVMKLESRKSALNSKSE
ncbi:MAG: hypothetical protein NUV80_04945 [Candidatus Berkelbacteria bacterium]|nr:hypothetical protein [Candidatus Berkelbacteria bacterium]